MSRPAARGWCRYVSIGPLQLRGLVDVARRNGMRCIDAYKPDMHFYYEIALWGTSEQMTATERDWKADHRFGGHEFLARKPPGAFGISADVPREKWVDRDAPSPPAPRSDKP